MATYTPEQQKLFQDLHSGLQGFVGGGQEQTARDIYNEKQAAYNFTDDDYLAQTGASYNANGTSRPYTTAELAAWKNYGKTVADTDKNIDTTTGTTTTGTKDATKTTTGTDALKTATTDANTTATQATAPVDYMAQVDAILGRAKSENASPDPLKEAKTYEAQQVTVDPTKTTQGLLESMLREDSPYLQLARSRAMEGMNERGLLSSSLAQGAGVDAAIGKAGEIAGIDSGIYSNTALANMAAKNRAGEFNAGAGNDFTKTQFEADSERANLGLTSAVNLANTALTGKINSDLVTQKSKLGLGEMKYGAELDAWKMGIAAGFDTDKMNTQQKLDFEKIDKNQINLVKNMAIEQGYKWDLLSEGARLDILKLVKGGDIQSVRDAFLSAADMARTQYTADSSSATSRYNTDMNYRAKVDGDNLALGQSIIADKELSADRKQALLKGLGLDQLAAGIMIPSAEVLLSEGTAYKSMKSDPNSSYNNNATVKAAQDRKADVNISNILVSNFMTPEQKKAALANYGVTDMAGAIAVLDSVKDDLTASEFNTVSTGLIGSYGGGGPGAADGGDSASSDGDSAGGVSV